MTLAEFLLARIAEDEAAIRAEYARPELDARRGLAECEAKRRIVERCIRLSKSPRARDHEVAQDFLTDLAIAYADHPDYRDQAG
jgi:hypothetical protein